MCTITLSLQYPFNVNIYQDLRGRYVTKLVFKLVLTKIFAKFLSSIIKINIKVNKKRRPDCLYWHSSLYNFSVNFLTISYKYLPVTKIFRTSLPVVVVFMTVIETEHSIRYQFNTQFSLTLSILTLIKTDSQPPPLFLTSYSYFLSCVLNIFQKSFSNLSYPFFFHYTYLSIRTRMTSLYTSRIREERERGYKSENDLRQRRWWNCRELEQ